MFVEIETMMGTLSGDNNELKKGTINGAIDLFLRALRAWGTTSALVERIKLYQQASTSLRGRIFVGNDSDMLDDLKSDLFRRSQQTAAGYLQKTADPGSLRQTAISPIPIPSKNQDTMFDVENMVSSLEERIIWISKNHHVSLCDNGFDKRVTSEPFLSPFSLSIALEALSELTFMRGDYLASLKWYLELGARLPVSSLSVLEKIAIEQLSKGKIEEEEEKKEHFSSQRYMHIIAMIKTHGLKSHLLRNDFLSIDINRGCCDDGNSIPYINPLIALLCLVGLDAWGDFMVNYCVLPKLSSSLSPSPSFSEIGYGDEDAGLPIDIVAFQLRSFPKILHWFLHKVFRENPEIYVSFPNTAVPPRVIIDLHRDHLELFVKFADTTVDKHKRLSDVTLYETINHDSILMKFLKVSQLCL